MAYYDWGRTLSFDADVTMVVAMRGVGKTYGLRLQAVRDFMKDGSRFVEVCRYTNEIADTAAEWFDRIISNDEFPGWTFKTEGRRAFAAPVPEDDSKKPTWRQCGYFVSLTQVQRSKKRTFANVRRIIFDEAVLDTQDRYHSYLKNEYSLLAKLVDSCGRERFAQDGAATRPPRVYLLGNSCDLLNPYFERYGVDRVPGFGYSWHDSKTFLLHYVDPGELAERKLDGTVAGRMLRGSGDTADSIYNRFSNDSSEFIAQKTRAARFSFALAASGRVYGVWCDEREGFYYVTDGAPAGSDSRTFYLAAADGRVNRIAARRVDKWLKAFIDLYYAGVVRYSSHRVRQGFLQALGIIGVR